MKKQLDLIFILRDFYNRGLNLLKIKIKNYSYRNNKPAPELVPIRVVAGRFIVPCSLPIP